MRRIVLIILFFVVVLFFAIFLGLNWGISFHLNLGFGSGGADVPVILWTLGSFAAGAFCAAIIFATSLRKKAKKAKRIKGLEGEPNEPDKENAG
jgi:uncharacterized integral membrane protein